MPLKSRLAVSVSILAVLASTGVLQAATRTWDGGGGTGLMNTAANWSSNITPVGGDIAQWDATVPGNLSLTWTAGWAPSPGINILVTSGHTGSLIMTGNSDMAFNDTFEVQSLAGAVSLGVGSGSFAMTFRGSNTPLFTNNSANTVTFGSNITGWNYAAGGGRNATYGGTGDWQIDGNYITSPNGSGLGSLTKNGIGTMTLNGSQNGRGVPLTSENGNTLHNIIINAGTLKFGAAAQLSSVTGNFGEYSRAIVNDGTFEWASSANQTLSAGMSGSGALVLSGAGALTLSGANAYTGDTTITGGTLIARRATSLGTGGAADVSVAANTNLTYNAATNTALNIGGNLDITGGASTVIGTSIGTTATSAQINVAGNATTTAADIKVNIYGVNGVTHFGGLTTLIHGVGGSSSLDNATYTLGTVYNNTDFTVGAFTKSATDLQVTTTSATALTTAFWKGGLAGNANVWAASDGSTTSNWTTTAGGTVQALIPGSGADVTISATAPTTAPTATVLGADMSIKSLTIADTANGLGLNADGYTLTIGTGGITVNSSVPASTIGANVTLGAAQAWTNNSANLLTVSGGVNNGANNLTVTGSGNTTVSAAITGAGGLTKLNSGTLTLSGGAAANTYSGLTTVTGGEVDLNKSDGTNAIAGNTLVNGGLLKLLASNQIIGTVGVSSGTFNLQSFNETVTGVQMTGGSIMSSTGTLTSTSAFDVQAGSASARLAGSIGLNKTTTGIATLSGSNSFTGTTAITAGTLIITNSTALGTTAAGTSVADGAVLRLDGTGGALAVGAEALTLNGAGLTSSPAGALRNIAGANSWAGAITLGSASTIQSDASTLTLSGGIINGGNLLTIQGAGNTTVSTAAISGAGGLTKLNSGTLSLGNGGGTANTYTGLTTVTGGLLTLNKADGTNTIAGDGNTGTNDVTVNGGTLRWLQNNQIADTASIALSSGTVDLNGRTETLYGFSNSGGTFTTGTGHLIGNGNTITWSGGTNTVNNGGLVEDAHIVISGGTNTIEGGATGGVLQLNVGGAGLEMSNGSTLTLNSDNTVAGKLVLKDDVSTSGDSTVSISSGLALTNKGTVDLDGGTRTFTVADGAAGTDFAVSAVISNGGLTKDDAGTMSLGAANTYSGATTVTAGTLVLAAGGSIASSTLVGLNAGATFDTTAQSFVMLGSQTFNFTIDATGSGSAGLLNAGALNISAGVVTFNLIGTLDDSVYILANYGALVGTPTFASVTAPVGYTLNYNYGGGTQIALEMVVPEPNTVGLFLGGLGLLAIFRRRRA